MRGDASDQLWMLTPITPHTLVPEDHPVRAIRVIVDRALASLSPTFRGDVRSARPAEKV